MKLLLFPSLSIFVFVTLIWAQDTASVTLIPATGDYLLQYTVNGIQYADTLEPPTKIDPIVSCITTFNNSTGLYTYAYRIGLLSSSRQSLMSFSVEHKAQILSPQKPNATWMMLAWYQQLWKWSNSLINPSGLRPDTTNIAPGESLGGFSFRSVGLPTIVKGYFSGNAISLAFTGEPPSLMEELLAPLIVFPNDQVIRLTIGPTTPPTPFNGLNFLDTIKSYITQSRALGWITNDPTANKYTRLIDTARFHLQANNRGVTKAKLDSVLINVYPDSAAGAITSEAYALLRFNTEYVLKKLDEE